LPEPTSPCSSRSILPGQVALDLGKRIALRFCEAEGEGALDLRPEFARRVPRRAAPPPQAGAPERQCKLTRRQLVEGEALPGRAGRAKALGGLGEMREPERFAERGPAARRKEIR
jgi:hypothetical protein